ncbi:hypothetical protein TNCV_4429091 [Trichonephila clavipes]|nr:hypothetical protein TNCV_4429091 [Trichonephila clavipes]
MLDADCLSVNAASSSVSEDRRSLVVKVTDLKPRFHELEPSAAEDPPYRGADACYICRGSNVLPLVWKFGEGCRLRCPPRHLTMV